jgi:hypothetical protein
MVLEMPCHVLRLCGIDLCQGLHPVPTPLGCGSDNRHGRNQLLYILTPASGAAWRILMVRGADQRLVLPLTRSALVFVYWHRRSTLGVLIKVSFSPSGIGKERALIIEAEIHDRLLHRI